MESSYKAPGKMVKSFRSISIEEQTGPPKSDGSASKSDPNHIEEGVILSDKEKEYLPPHFTGMVVGRPGAGKTYLLRQITSEPGFYKGKFDRILLVSPSAQKMGIPVPKKQMCQNFDLGWIEEQIWDINKRQRGIVEQKLRDAGIIDKFDVSRLNGQLMDEFSMKPEKGKPEDIPKNAAQEKERFFSSALFKKQSMIQQASKKSKGVAVDSDRKIGLDLIKYVDESHNQLVKKMSAQMRRETYFNCLLIMDDVISQLKANEFNPLLTQLIFNRRHLVINGMLSVLIVAQKFTMIPSRIRSNANWLVMFKQNPNDLLAVYKDVVQLYPEQWEQIVEAAFGAIEKNRNHLDILIEKD